MTFRKKFANLIKAARKERNMSQSEFGVELGVDGKYVSKIERAEKNIRIDTIDKYLSKINKTHADIFSLPAERQR